MSVFTGPVLHKRYFIAIIMDESGNALVQEDFPNKTEDYDSLLAKIWRERKVASEAAYAWECVRGNWRIESKRSKTRTEEG